jgi:hypothetical protein
MCSLRLWDMSGTCPGGCPAPGRVDVPVPLGLFLFCHQPMSHTQGPHLPTRLLINLPAARWKAF